MKFDIINEINEAIKSIKDTSFQIRLCALNSQISVSNITSEIGKTSGLSTISEELIHISNLLEKKANQLFLILHESIHLSTTERKLARNHSLQNKFFQDYSNRDNQKFNLREIESYISSKYNDELENIRAKISTRFESLKPIIQEANKLCKYAKPIVFSVKIESAYLGENIKVFTQLAEELANSIVKIEMELKQIQNLNIELQNSTG